MAHLYSRDEDRVRLAVLLARVRADEGAEVVVLHLLLVPARERRAQLHRSDTRGGGKGEDGDAPRDEVSPALLARLALHPLLVELRDLRVVVLRELGERRHRVVKDFIVDPVSSDTCAWRVTGARMEARKHGRAGQDS